MELSREDVWEAYEQEFRSDRRLMWVSAWLLSGRPKWRLLLEWVMDDLVVCAAVLAASLISIAIAALAVNYLLVHHIVSGLISLPLNS